MQHSPQHIPNPGTNPHRTMKAGLPQTPSAAVVGKPAGVSETERGAGVARRAKAAPVPSLRNGNDAEVAAKLRELVADAESALRRILICGAFLHRITAELPHGQLGRWVEAHCPEMSYRTVRRWKDIVQRVVEAIGTKWPHVATISAPLDEVLALPIADVPKDAIEIRTKIDLLIAGKSMRQLWFDFKQVEEDVAGNVSVKAGRRKGEGGRPTDAELLARTTTSERIEAEQVEAFRAWSEMEAGLVDYEGFMVLPDATTLEQIEFLKGLIKARETWLKPAPHNRDRLKVRKILKSL